ncbi:MAG: hypothetical protein ABGW87_01540 [Sphingomonadaceae bacterium]
MTRVIIRNLMGLILVALGTALFCYIVIISMFVTFQNFDLVEAWNSGGRLLFFSLFCYAGIIFGAMLAYAGAWLMDRDDV